MKKTVYIFLGMMIAFSHPGQATMTSTSSLVNQVQSFLNGIHCLVANFIQTNPDQSQVQGKIWLVRGGKGMGKMLLEYCAEQGQKILAKEGEFIIYDLHDKNETHYALEHTPAAFILKPRINLQKDVTVDSISKKEDHLQLVVTQPGDATGQSLTLYFSLYPNGNLKALEQWVVLDMQGNQTLVQFVPGTMVINNSGLVPDSIFKF